MLPAAASRFWGREVWSMVFYAMGTAFASGYLGLLASYHLRAPSGPAIVLVASGFYVFSILFGRYGGVLQGLGHRRHFRR
jgi:zinc/manganese transport system permease protein